MPGLIGFVKKNRINSKLILSDLRELLVYRDFYKKDPIFEDDYICASRVHKGIQQPNAQPFESNGVFLWLNGEFFRDNQYADTNSDLSFFLEQYERHSDFSYLKHINGVYNAVLYDRNKNKIFLITDMFGLKPLYWTDANNSFAWASEVKALALAPWVSPVVNKNMVKTFFSQGYLSDNYTWFENILLVPHGSVITYDICSGKISKSVYWDFSDVTIKEKCKQNELIEEMGYLFKRAVTRCTKSDHRFGVSVSGGLDSRAILAMFPDLDIPLHSYTFGYNECIDDKIAKRVSAIKKADYHFFELTENDWLQPRLEGVWFTDGQVNLMHMHGIEFLSKMRGLFDIELNGFIGDVVLGGSLSGRIPFRFTFLNRLRRFVRAMLETTELELHTRMPFIDRDVMLFSLSTQPYLRNRWFLYSKMLMRSAPDYYASIPWEKIGMPISMPFPIIAANLFSLKAEVKFRSMFNLPGKKSSYSDYSSWIRAESVIPFFKELLCDSRCLHKEYIDHSKVEQAMLEHSNGNDRSYFLCLCMTFELWLRQIYNKEYRK